MQEKVLKRSEVPEELTWRLEDIYADDAAWEAEVEKLKSKVDEIAAYEGKISKNSKDLYDCLKCLEEAQGMAMRVFRYSSCHFHSDMSDPKYQTMYQKGAALLSSLGEKTAFISPEILGISDENMEEFLKETPEISYFDVTIKDTRRLRDHTLSKEMEQLLASASESLEVPQKGFEMLSVADLRFPDITDSEGNTIPLTQGRFVPLQMSKDRDLRKKSFEALYGRFKEFANTWAAFYDGEMKGRIFITKARKYDSCFEAIVDGNNVSPSVCDGLIEAVHRGMGTMHRYVKLRKELLGVDELHMYDVYVSMIKDFEMEVDFEKAKVISLEALAPLGEDYLNVVKEAYANRWIDVLENEGKRGGAYSASVAGVHPYMLLNYNNTLDDVFTLVHEMGHTMHTWYSEKTQHPLDAEYKIFVAEVASTTNEVLLYHYLKDRASSTEEKAFVINHFLESYKGTLFRQVMFTEFERKTNEMAEQGIPLTAEAICDVYLDLNKQYFGEAMVSDELIAYEWCRIPHFYDKFYVYQYATSFCAAVQIADRILKEGEPYVEQQYKEFLKGGCSKDPVSLLKIAGVDLTTSKPIDDALKVFDEVITEMEELYK